MQNGSKQYEWVIGVYSGDPARKIKSHAESAIGYFIRRESGAGMNYRVEVAFRRAIIGPRPQYLEVATDSQIKTLEELYNKRHNINPANV